MKSRVVLFLSVMGPVWFLGACAPGVHGVLDGVLSDLQAGSFSTIAEDVSDFEIVPSTVVAYKVGGPTYEQSFSGVVSEEFLEYFHIVEASSSIHWIEKPKKKAALPVLAVSIDLLELDDADVPEEGNQNDPPAAGPGTHPPSPTGGGTMLDLGFDPPTGETGPGTDIFGSEGDMGSDPDTVGPGGVGSKQVLAMKLKPKHQKWKPLGSATGLFELCVSLVYAADKGSYFGEIPEYASGMEALDCQVYQIEVSKPDGFVIYVYNE